MVIPTNTVVRLKARPAGMPGPEHFDIRTEPTGVPGDGEVLVAVRYVSVSPSLRLQMNAGGSYLPPVPIGGIVRARGVGEVLESRASGFAPGDHVEGGFGPQSHYSGPTAGLVKVDPATAPIQRYLGVLGMSGLTAYFGLLDICAPSAGETVLVSAAAGSVGSVVGQIARRVGCRVVGLAGGPAKCGHVTDELGFNACIDYRHEDVGARLDALAPAGIDIFFDNVGGSLLDAALARLARHGRIAICGAISAYNDIGAMHGPKNILKLLEMRARMEGFSVFDYIDRHAEARDELARWVAAGEIRPVEHVERGLERFPEALRMLFEGAHTGKLMIEV